MFRALIYERKVARRLHGRALTPGECAGFCQVKIKNSFYKNNYFFVDKRGKVRYDVLRSE